MKLKLVRYGQSFDNKYNKIHQVENVAEIRKDCAINGC